MQTTSIRTTQNVVIQYPLASPGDRILAQLNDAGIVTLAPWNSNLPPAEFLYAIVKDYNHLTAR